MNVNRKRDVNAVCAPQSATIGAMRVIYHAENVIDANLLKGLLAQQDIMAFVNGAHLQGGVGELPAIGLITVSVTDHDYPEAKPIAEKFATDLAEGVYAVDESSLAGWSGPEPDLA